MKRIGVLGGSFNPPHLGHLLAAVYALKRYRLDEVWLVPAHRHAFGKHLAPFRTRIEMCKALCSDLSPPLCVSDIEYGLRNEGRMLLTLGALKKRHPSSTFRLLIGSDLLAETRRWHRFSEIRRRFGVLVIPRQRVLRGGPAIPNISSRMVRTRLKKGAQVDDLVTPAVAKILRRRNGPLHRQ